MKLKAILVLGTLLFSSLAAAGNIVEVSTSGGFTGNVLPARGIRIQDNGNIVSFEGVKSEVIAKLSLPKLKAFVKAINALHTAPLKRENPEAPLCMDAPSTSYKVIQTGGQSIELANNANCQMSYLENGEGRLLVTVLEGLKTLNYIQ